MTAVRTNTSPLFRRSAEELAHRLAGETSPEGVQMLAEAHELMEVFATWQVQRPADDVRVSYIHRLFELNRRVMDHISQGVHPTLPPGSRRYTP